MNRREEIDLQHKAQIAIQLKRIADSLDLLIRWLDSNAEGKVNLNIETGPLEVKVHDKKIGIP